MATYRLRIDWTYSNASNATTATTNVNNVLAAQGYAERAVRTNAVVGVVVEPIADEAAAVALRNALTTAWSSATRSGGKASIVRRDE